MGRMGRLVANVSGVGAYVKPITPVYGSDTSFAIAVLNRNNRANDVEFKLRNLGLTNDRGYIPQRSLEQCADGESESGRHGTIPSAGHWGSDVSGRADKTKSLVREQSITRNSH
ncbi:hypothetical protein OSTOST_17470 [Ostertagia ostertagi]